VGRIIVEKIKLPQRLPEEPNWRISNESYGKKILLGVTGQALLAYKRAFHL